jgi:hypothetical protein
MLILERLGSRRVYESTDGDNWTRSSYNHPFNIGSHVVVTIPDHGVIWGLGNNMGTPFSKLWKPADSPTLAGPPMSVTTAKDLTINVAPNPFNSGTTISIGSKEAGSKEAKIKIYDVTGHLCFFASLPPASSSIAWNTSTLPAGVYVVKASINNQILTKKLFLQK